MNRPAKSNPFRVQKLENLSFRYLQQDKTAVLQRLRQQRFRGEISGPEGSGKTLLLKELLAALNEQKIKTALITLKHGEPGGNFQALWKTLPALDNQTVLALDGSEQLGVPAWLAVRALTRRLRGLIITTHLPGRLPFLYRCYTTPQLLQNLIEELLEKHEKTTVQDAATLYALYNGNIRAALLNCYDAAGG